MKAAFFVRHHNDYDSLAPVADGWVNASADNQAMVFFASPAVKWRDDYRTRILRRTGRVKLVDTWEIAGRNPEGAIARRWVENKPDLRLQRRLLEWSTELALLPVFNKRLLRALKDFGPDIIAFDWWDVPERRKPFDHFGYQHTVVWAKENKIPLVSLPHGLFLYIRNSGKAGEYRWKTPYSRIFVENQMRKQMFVDDGTPPQNVSVCGAPRYDPVWVQRALDELEAPQSHVDDGLVRIVFFDKRRAYYFDFDEHLQWLRHLADHPKVRLIIQPHPRGQKLSSLKSIADHPHIEIDAETTASELISRSDIVSTLTSSVMVEGVVRGKEILYPKFLMNAVTRFEQVGACIALESSEDTHTAIDRYLDGQRIQRSNYDNFLRDVVFGGGDGNTIKRICAEMIDLASLRNP